MSFNLGDWSGDGAKSSKSTTSITTATPFTTDTTTTPHPSSKSGKVSLSTKSSKSGGAVLSTKETAMSLLLIQEQVMTEGDGDGGGLTQRDDMIVTPTISPTRCNDADMIWYYDSNKGLCTNEEVDMDTAEDTDMILYESLGECCDLHFNIRVSNDLGVDFDDSNGIDSGGCNSFDICEVSWIWYQTFNICLYLSFSYHLIV